MQKKLAVSDLQFKRAWEKYHDTLWKIEQAWDDPKLGRDKKVMLTETVVELIKIEKKLKRLESQHQKGKG